MMGDVICLCCWGIVDEVCVLVFNLCLCVC